VREIGDQFFEKGDGLMVARLRLLVLVLVLEENPARAVNGGQLLPVGSLRGEGLD
jgi:hypothetical protein